MSNELLNGHSFAAKVDFLEREMLAMPQASCDVVHRFAPGIYIREVHLPADAFVIGHRHKTVHMNILLQGRLTLVLGNGQHLEVSAPYMALAEPGRKVAYVHEDVVWLNVFSTTETDVDALELAFLDKSEAFNDAQLLLTHQRTEDVEDYFKALSEFGIDTAHAVTVSYNEDDQCDFPYGEYRVKVGKSPIEGRGLFATSEIASGEVIAPARIDGLRTPAGRYTNHAKSHNAIMEIRENGDIDLVALTDIRGCRGGQEGEEITVDYRRTLDYARLAA